MFLYAIMLTTALLQGPYEKVDTVVTEMPIAGITTVLDTKITEVQIAGITTILDNPVKEIRDEAPQEKKTTKKKVKKAKAKETALSKYTDEEISYFERLVEAEATGGDIESKKNVASVVINRVHSDRFEPDTIVGVINQKNPTQFSPTSDGRIWKVTVTDDTRAAVKYVLENGPTTSALYFCNYRDVKNLQTQAWFRRLTYLFTDDVGHSFYK